MSLLNVDLFADQYADYVHLFPVWLAGGVPTDFTGATARMMVRVNPTDATAPLVSITTTLSAQGQVQLGPVSGGTYGDVPAGAVLVAIAKAQLGVAFNAATALFYNLFIDWPNGTTTPFASGRFLLSLSTVH